MENNDYIRWRDGDGTKAAQRQNVRRSNVLAPRRSRPNVTYRQPYISLSKFSSLTNFYSLVTVFQVMSLGKDR